MYFYVKTAHVGAIPGIKECIDAFLDDDASGTCGYLTDKGLIPLDDAEREAIRDAAMSLSSLTLNEN